MKGKTRGDQPVHAVDAVYFQDAELGTLGLTKREYFAGLAMQGMIGSDSYENSSIADIAVCAKDMADALISELSKEEE